MQTDNDGSPKLEEVDQRDLIKNANSLPANKESNYDKIMRMKAAKNSKLKVEE